LAAKSQALGAKVRAAFMDLAGRYDCIGDVRGLGSMLAMELVHDKEAKTPAPDIAKALVAKCRENGLIILSCGHFGNVIRTLMPLVISDAELEKGLSVLEAAFAEVTKG
jgi:4-aminobutyrate aminotransferase/(S)-3-amino-2-methylpropionate transaminase